MVFFKLKKLVRNIDRYSPYPLFYVLRMTANEVSLFDKYIKSSAHYLEFGSGGSTIRTLQKSNAKVYSVESSIEWIIMLENY